MGEEFLKCYIIYILKNTQMKNNKNSYIVYITDLRDVAMQSQRV